MPATPATEVQPEDHRNALDRKVLQKTPVLAMAQAQTCRRSHKCTKVASEPSFPALLQLALVLLSSRIKPLLEMRLEALSISFFMSLMSLNRSQRVTSQFLRPPS